MLAFPTSSIQGTKKSFRDYNSISDIAKQQGCSETQLRSFIELFADKKRCFWNPILTNKAGQWFRVDTGSPGRKGKPPMRVSNAAGEWASPSRLIGFTPQNDSRFIVLDIDKKGAENPYHPEVNPDGFRAVLAAMEGIGLCRHLAVTSSHSGGLHIYFPLPGWRNSWELATLAELTLIEAGLTVAPGTLEISPNTKAKDATYSSLRMPLQPGTGSIMLDSDESSVSAFLATWWQCAKAQDMELLDSLLPDAKFNFYRFSADRRGEWRNDLKKFRADLEDVLATGWTGHSQTFRMMKNIAEYVRVFEQVTDQAQLEARIVELATTRPGYQKWCGHQHEINRKARDAAKWAMKERYPAKGNTAIAKPKKETNPNHHAELANSAQARIQAAWAQLSPNLPCQKTARANAIAKEAKCSLRTLYKYQSIWWTEPFTQTPAKPSETLDVSLDESNAVIPDPARDLSNYRTSSLRVVDTAPVGEGDAPLEQSPSPTGQDFEKIAVPENPCPAWDYGTLSFSTAPPPPPKPASGQRIGSLPEHQLPPLWERLKSFEPDAFKRAVLRRSIMALDAQLLDSLMTAQTLLELKNLLSPTPTPENLCRNQSTESRVNDVGSKFSGDSSLEALDPLMPQENRTNAQPQAEITMPSEKALTENLSGESWADSP